MCKTIKNQHSVAENLKYVIIANITKLVQQLQHVLLLINLRSKSKVELPFNKQRGRKTYVDGGKAYKGNEMEKGRPTAYTASYCSRWRNVYMVIWYNWLELIHSNSWFF